MVDDLDIEKEMTRAETAAYLREFADELESGGKVVFVAGNHSTTINPPDAVRLKVSAQSDSSWIGGGDAESMVFEMGWSAEEVVDDDELTVVRHDDERRAKERVQEISEQLSDGSEESEERPRERTPGN